MIFKTWHPFQQNFEGQRLTQHDENMEWCEHEVNRAFGWPIQCPGSWRKREPLNGALFVCLPPHGLQGLEPLVRTCSRNLLLSKKPPQKVESGNHSDLSLSSEHQQG